MTSLVLAFLLQDQAFPFEARVRIERWAQTGDRVVASSGRLRVRPGRALELVEEGKRVVIREGRPPERFHPAELWLHEWAELRRRFQVTVEPEPDEPSAVTGPDGAPREPVRAKLRGAAVAGGKAEGALVFRLAPRDPALRRRLSSIRAFADPETLRIVRAVFNAPMQATVMTLDGYREAGSMEDPAFDFDAPGVRMEDR